MEDRVENWKKFAEHMEKYIKDRTVEKYGVKNSGETSNFDLISITRNPLICVWNILRYSLRIWNGKEKTHDIEKIAHYAELSWTMSDGKVVGKVDCENGISGGLNTSMEGDRVR